jgi:hypothetical protein
MIYLWNQGGGFHMIYLWNRSRVHQRSRLPTIPGPQLYNSTGLLFVNRARMVDVLCSRAIVTL